MAKAEEKLCKLHEELEKFGLKIARERIEALREEIEALYDRLLEEVEFDFELPKLGFEWISPAEVECEFEAEVITIVEFVDADNDSQVDEEEVVQRLHLEDISWKITVEALLDPETNETRCKVTYECEVDGCRIRIIAWVCQSSEELVDGAAEEAKLTFVIENWPWVREDSLIAIYATIEVEVEGPALPIPKTIELFGEQGIYIELPEGYVKFDWTRNVTIDGEVKAIVNVYIEKAEIEIEEGEYEAEYEIALVYPRGTAIEHDPGVGIEDDPAELAIIREIAAPAPVGVIVQPPVVDLTFLTMAVLVLRVAATPLALFTIRRLRGIPKPAAVHG